VPVGVGDHDLEQLALSLLHVGAAVELAAHLLEASGERVAHRLELAQAQQPRAAAGADPPLDAASRKCGAEQGREVTLHAGDLAAKLHPGKALVGIPYARTAADSRRDAPPRTSGQRIGHRRNWIEKLGHQLPLA
jgi:hypothetical protein